MEVDVCDNCGSDFVHDDMVHAYTYGRGNMIFCSIQCVAEFMAEHNVQGSYRAK